MLELNILLVIDWLSELFLISFLWRDPSVHRLVISPLCDTVCLLDHQKWKKCSVSIKESDVEAELFTECNVCQFTVLQVFNILICKRQHEVNSTVFTLKRKNKYILKKFGRKFFVFIHTDVVLTIRTSQLKLIYR